MERLILDSGVLIAAERGTLEPPSIEADIVIAAITASELLVGVEMADQRYRERRARSVELVLSTYEVIPFDVSVARHHARLVAHARRTGRPRGAHDLLIAATASATGRVVITTDPEGFRDLPLVTWRAADIRVG